MPHYENLLRPFLQAGPAEVRWTATGLSIVIAGIWTALTGVLAFLMVVLFLVDVGLGVLRATHVGGLGAFSWDRLFRGAAKFGAAMLGVVLSASVDMVIQQTSTVDATVLTSGVLAFMCWGFAWSSAQSLSYFFPGVEKVLDRAMGRAKNGDGTIHPMRRRSDTPKEGGAS